MSYLCLVVVLCSRYTNLTQHEPDTSIWSLYGRVFCVYTNQWLSYIPTANHKYRRSPWIIIQTNHSVAHTLIYLGQACVMSVAKDFRAYRWVSLVSGKQESSIHEMRTVRSSWKRRNYATHITNKRDITTYLHVSDTKDTQQFDVLAHIESIHLHVSVKSTHM